MDNFHSRCSSKWTLRLAGWSFLLIIGTFLPALVLGEAQISLESQPTGARVCERKRGGITCFARTPCDLPAMNYTKKYYLQKVGYEQATVSVKGSEKIVRVALKKMDVFVPDDPNDDPQLRHIQAQVVRRLSEKLFGNAAGIDDTGFGLYGQVGTQKFPDGYFIEFGILLDDEFRQTRYRSIRRIRNRTERQAAIVRAVLDHSAERLLVELKGVLNGVDKLKGVLLYVFYAKSAAVLGEDLDRFTMHRVWQWQQGQTIYEKHSIHTEDVSRSEVKDVKDIDAVIVKIGFQDILTDPAKRREKVLTAAEIFSDDNPEKKLERVVLK